MKLLVNLLLLLPLFSLAQESVISGQVTDNRKKPVIHVNIFIDGTYDGGQTDSLGYYHFSTTATGSKIIKVTAIGYISQSASILIKENTILNFTLNKESKEIDEVIVQAGQFRVGNLSKSVMSPLDIVTTAGSNGNIVAALEKLPGAQIAGEDGRLMVRGGSPHETQTYINGIRVAQPYSNSANGVPVRGCFSPFLFQGTSFSTGGYSAEYGNALSSILNLTTSLQIEPAKTEVTLSNVTLGLSNTQHWNKSSLSFNTGYTNLKPYSNIIPQRAHWTKPYEQFSGEAIFKNKGKNHFLNIYAAYSFEKMGVEDYDINYDQIVGAKINGNTTYLNSTYLQYLPNNWKWESGASYSYANKNTQYHVFAIPNTDWHIHLKSKANKRVNSLLQFTFGGEYFYDNIKEQISSPDQNTYKYGFQQKIGAAFATANFRLWEYLFVETGLRYNTDFDKNKSINPRLNVTYQINNKNQASFAYGIFHQNAADEVLKYANNLSWSEAQHYILNYNYTSQHQQLRIELFRKKYNHLVQYNSPSPAYDSNYYTQGNGVSQGLDIFWKDSKSIRNLQYWVSYSLTDVHKLEQNYPVAVQPNYVAKHYFSVVAKYWISDWRSQVGLTNTFISGRPYNNPNQPNFMSERTKNRNDLSFNWSYLLTQQKIIHISVTNLLGQSPIYGYKYSDHPNAQGKFAAQPILPTAKRFIFVGFFWTISKNKQENNLDNL